MYDVPVEKKPMTDAQKKLVAEMNEYIFPPLPIESDRETAKVWINKYINRVKFLKQVSGENNGKEK